MTEMNAESAVKAKETFEQLAHSYTVVIKYYYSDNGIFGAKLFNSSILHAHQSITFCGINAYHQNGKAKRCIKYVTSGTRISLLHASHC